MPSHSLELYGLIVALVLLTGAYSWWHARRNWEGLPPLLDALFSMAGLVLVFLAFAFGTDIGEMRGGHPHAGRVTAVALTLLGLRWRRTRLGKEQAEQMKGRK